MNKWNNKKDELEKLILTDKLSYETIGKLFNCSGTNIKKVAIRLGIDLPQKRKINSKETFNKGVIRVPIKKCLNCGKEFKQYSGSTGKFCCIQCSSEYKHKQTYQLVLNGDPSIMRANWDPSCIKNEIMKEQDNKCAICHCKNEHNGKSLVFILDHIDGHASNNCRSNLRCICPNCDSQLDTYKSKNKNGDRHYYRYSRIKENSV